MTKAVKSSVWNGGMQLEMYTDAAMENGYIVIFDEGAMRIRFTKVADGVRTTVFDR